MRSSAILFIISLMLPTFSWAAEDFTLENINDLVAHEEMNHVNLDCHVDESTISLEMPTQLECLADDHLNNAGDPIKIFIRLGADVKNAMVGSVPTNNQAELDLYVALPITAKIFGMSNIEVTPSFESFHRIGYQRIAVAVGKSFEFNRFTYTPGLEVGMIDRTQFGRFYNYGINNSIQFRITKAMSVGLIIQAQNREDLNQVYGLKDGKYPNVRFSNFLYLTIRLK